MIKVKLAQYFYENGSRSREVLTNYIGEQYKGAIQSDGLINYKILETGIYPGVIRLGCFQHCKRKFLDIYVNYFGMKFNKRYTNTDKNYSSYFLSFEEASSRIELMHRPDIKDSTGKQSVSFGLTHFSISVGSKKRVDDLTRKLRTDGYKIVGEPRTTGDGYYESVIEDCEGNWVEITE